MRYYEVMMSDEIYQKLEDLQKKWNKEQKTKYTVWDITRICLNTIWENEINSLNKTLTNTSKS